MTSVWKFTTIGLALGIILSIWAAGWALDSPHYQGNSVQCKSCHFPHNALGKNLGAAATNPLVCQQCHLETKMAENFPMPDSSRAIPGTGSSHQWSVNANNATYGASTPPSTYAQNTMYDMQIRLDNTDAANPKIICSTCHDQHASTNKWGRIHLSPVTRVDALGGNSGTVTYSAVDHQSKAQGYLVEIVNGGAVGVATYKIQDGSSDAQGNLKWLGWDGAQWVTYSANARVAGTNQQLQDGANTLISFDTSAFSFVAGQQFKFYIGYPFLRRTHDSGGGSPSNPEAGATYFCRNCHSQRAQSHTDVESWTGAMRSHPVGQGLGSNGKGYDRAVPLDWNGQPQDTSAASPDGNWTNDLLLFPAGSAGNSGATPAAATKFGDATSGDVQCMSCHAPHFTDSNPRTVDKR